MCLIIKTIKSYRNDWNERLILNQMYPSIFLSPEQVKSRLREIESRELAQASRQRALGRQPLEQPLSPGETEVRRQEVDAQHKLMISGQGPVTKDMNDETEPNQYHTAVFGFPSSGARGGSRRKRTAHRKRKNRRKSKRVHHTHKKHTRRHRHSHRRHHRH